MIQTFLRVSKRFTNVANDSHVPLIKRRYYPCQHEEMMRGIGESLFKRANLGITNGTQLEEIKRMHPRQLEELRRRIEEMNINHANARITNGEQAEGVYRFIFPTKMDFSILSLLILFEMKADFYAGIAVHYSKKVIFGRSIFCKEPAPEDARKLYKNRLKGITYNSLLELEPSYAKQYILKLCQDIFGKERFEHPEIPGIKKIELRKVIPILIIMRHYSNAGVQLFKPLVDASVKEKQERAHMRAIVIEDIKNAMAQNLLSENWTDMHDVIQLAIKYAGSFME